MAASEEEVDIYFRCIIPADGGYYTRGPWWKLKEEEDEETPWTPDQKRWIRLVETTCLGMAGDELIAKAAGRYWMPSTVSGIDVRDEEISWGDEHDDFSREHVLGGWAEHDDRNSGEIPFEELAFTTDPWGQDTDDDDVPVCGLDDDDDGGLCGVRPGRVFTWMVRRDERKPSWWDQLKHDYKLLTGNETPSAAQLRSFAHTLGRAVRIQYDLHGSDQVAKQLRF
jgi:hypothetical protein